MAEENKVTLHGLWLSSYVKRVELALKIKGIPYEYVEEDMKNKSPQLLKYNLKYNPVHKMVPILVHNGKPIVESSVILEYIDETWKNGPPLFLRDPYERAQVRFWASFVQQQLFETMISVIKSEGEAQQKVIKELLDKLKVFEEGVKKIFPEGIPSSINHETVGLLDIMVVTCFGPHEVQEEVLGFKFIDTEKTPLLFSWLKALREIPAVKEATPPHEMLVEALKYIRQFSLNK
ncbi:LOW QUALITY PROTEIN: glutathione S-transferase U9-like [Juglans microcarpa x Juglans regia]|uniref:LOW QUALITY PROTEIN: glutathione S-transferase U9-like n=1 Tax=Juglans microcarpa x Juglans regia TaxID=2249226 RepID=UPI001B7E8C8B|nr:LOW QUALITY PROTEIN: glutathione S-transferase U9-like [Juglans microcarpa x Juglans regia]